MKQFSRKADFELDELGKVILGVVLLIVLLIIIAYISGALEGQTDKIKSLFSFF